MGTDNLRTDYVLFFVFLVFFVVNRSLPLPLNLTGEEWGQGKKLG